MQNEIPSLWDLSSAMQKLQFPHKVLQRFAEGNCSCSSNTANAVGKMKKSVLSHPLYNGKCETSWGGVTILLDYKVRKKKFNGNFGPIV